MRRVSDVGAGGSSGPKSDITAQHGEEVFHTSAALAQSIKAQEG